jgi:hypothetical protein
MSIVDVIVGGAIAATSSVGGAWVTSNLQYARTKRLQWHERRIDECLAFLATASRCVATLSALATHNRTGDYFEIPRPQLLARFSEQWATLNDQTWRLRLLGSDAVNNAAEAVVDSVGRLHHVEREEITEDDPRFLSARAMTVQARTDFGRAVEAAFGGVGRQTHADTSPWRAA